MDWERKVRHLERKLAGVHRQVVFAGSSIVRHWDVAQCYPQLASFANVGLTGFIAIKTANHDEAWLKRFADGVSAIPEVVEFHRMAGDTDYLLKIVTKDIESYDAIYKRLIKVVDLNDVSASFSMEVIKSTTEVPVDYL